MAVDEVKFKLWVKEIRNRWRKSAALVEFLDKLMEENRPYGERVLRAAAKNEDWTKIPKPQDRD